MFESITIRRQLLNQASSPLDLGFLAETLLFYSQARVIGDKAVLEQLAKQCGPEVLLQLVEEGFLRFTYVENMPAVLNNDVGTTNERHRPVLIGVPALQDLPPDHGPIPKLKFQDAAPEIFVQAVGNRQGRGKRLARRFSKEVEIFNLEEEVTSQATDDLRDPAYVQTAVQNFLPLVAPGYPELDTIEFAIAERDEFFYVNTNIDFMALNNYINRIRNITDSALNKSSILVYLTDARTDLFFSSRYNSEIATNPANAAIIRTKYDALIKAASKGVQNISDFQELVLGKGHSVRDAINSGERSMKDLVPLLHSAQGFHKFLKTQSIDANLLAEYHKEVIKDSWVEKTPIKAMRVFIPTALGLLGFTSNPELAIGGVIGAAVYSAGDMFILNKLAKGWNPTQFEGSLREFTNASK